MTQLNALPQASEAPRAIHSAMGDLNAAVVRLQGVADRLCDRAGPILPGGSLSEGKAGQTGAPTPLRSPLCDVIHTTAARINATADQLDMLESKVEL